MLDKIRILVFIIFKIICQLLLKTDICAKFKIKMNLHFRKTGKSTLYIYISKVIINN